ncbi:MAG: hypothetical protein IJH12_03010 [Clostridia bacterium]|nr:hypothetical protein [Clostridia bacterium]
MKKYWSHILNIVYIVFVDCFVGMCAFGINNEEMMSGVPTAILPIGFIIILIMTFAILGEMIYAIVKAAQDTNLDNKALHIIGLYFFNVFYIPCFLLKHVSKEKKVAIRNTIYLILSLILYIALFVLTIVLPISTKQKEASALFGDDFCMADGKHSYYEPGISPPILSYDRACPICKKNFISTIDEMCDICAKETHRCADCGKKLK